jgi:sulfate transport system ATP-binding protein
MTVEIPGLVGRTHDRANVYVRPHELDIERYKNGVPSLPARVLRTNPAGSLAKVSLATEEGSEIQVDLPLERYLALNLQAGETVHVSPRKVRVFVPDYVI